MVTKPLLFTTRREFRAAINSGSFRPPGLGKGNTLINMVRDTRTFWSNKPLGLSTLLASKYGLIPPNTILQSFLIMLYNVCLRTKLIPETKLLRNTNLLAQEIL